jgi:DNA polymerase III epsilon subunit-like protein
MGHFRDRYGSFPSCYTVFDVETTGFGIGTDLIVQIGHALVEDGRIIDRSATILDWVGCGLVPNVGWLHDRMAKCKSQIEWTEDGRPTGHTYPFSLERMAAEGADPIWTLQNYLELFEDRRRGGCQFVGHNGYNFDAKRLKAEGERWLNATFLFGPDELWDTGTIEKACQSGLTPFPDDSLWEFADRVNHNNMRGVKWGLSNIAENKYHLVERHGLAEYRTHDAAYDCLLTYHLFEEFKEIANRG